MNKMMLLKFQVESGGICATLLKRASALTQRIELSLCHLFNTVTNGIEVDGGFHFKKNRDIHTNSKKMRTNLQLGFKIAP
jgi:hypothetical protein